MHQIHLLQKAVAESTLFLLQADQLLQDKQFLTIAKRTEKFPWLSGGD
ncbi:hypothetical protein [Peribacillus simplex]